MNEINVAEMPNETKRGNLIVPGSKEFGDFAESAESLGLRTSVGFTPVLDRVLVREIKTEAQTKLLLRGGFKLDLAQVDHRESFMGEVVGLGDGVPMGGVLMPMPFKLGQVIRYGKYGKEKILLSAEDEFDTEAAVYYLLRTADIKGIISVR